MSAPTIHESRFTVRAYEVGPDRRTQMGRMADYLQETAGHHATRLGLGMEELLARGVTWLLARLRLVVVRYPAAGEELLVRTWPSGLGRHTANRDWRILAEGEEVARATSNWVVFDFSRGRMVPMPREIGEKFPEGTPEPLLRFDSRSVGRLADPTDEAPLRARHSDLDMVGHVNNARLLEWAVEGTPARVREGRRIAEVDVAFRAEVRAGQTARSRSAVVEQEGAALLVAHDVLRDQDDVEAVRARSRWVGDDAAVAKGLSG